MDYKEKYQEALERAKKGLPIDEVFPELKESEDERIRKELIEAIERARVFDIDKEVADRWIAYLEKQKEQKPAEWSEEDTNLLNRTLSIIRWASDSDRTIRIIGDEGAIELENWLKSLKDRWNFPKSNTNSPSWKPSQEQMKALLSKLPVVKGSGDKVQDILESLYKDLKKLI